MEPPVTPKPMPASSPNLPTDHSSKLFGIVYITLTGVIGTIILAAGLWSWMGKSAYYNFKLALLLWWALPAKNLAQVTPGNNGPAAQDWISESHREINRGFEGALEKYYFYDYFDVIQHAFPLVGSSLGYC
ncbi:hypothetical protein DSO57_1039045 [Entomophthora muscae]|uniref:Uncharacterized protein n=1 Tax=Entomophthora muscae TaxID=34485 RepID=A0ACC2UJ86_9FUNG|nr:hypothetical protein DSO57_1039045 [Entomophthora muscae]